MRALYDPRSYAGRSLMLLAGPTKPDRSLRKGPDEACILALKARGVDSELTTRNCKKIYLVTETATKTQQQLCAMAFHRLQRLVGMAVVKVERKLLTGKWKSGAQKQRPGLDSGICQLHH